MNFNPAEFSNFEDYEKERFDFCGNPAIIVKPNCRATGKWAIKTEYFGAFPELEMELLNRGWHIAYNQNDNRWAEEADLQRKLRFIRWIPEKYGLNAKCAAIGMSCGGLYAVKLAALLPELFSALYLDAPVINLLSCPLGLGLGTDPGLYDEYCKCTGRTVSEMLSYRDNPLDKLSVLTENHVPVIVVAGDSDTVVPYSENGALLERFYKENAEPIEVHIKKDCNHHPHGLPNPSIIADYLELYE